MDYLMPNLVFIYIYIYKSKYLETYAKIDLQYKEISLKSQEPFHPRFVKWQPSEVI